jgi:proton-dependent oligopeptide transporter, POT family
MTDMTLGGDAPRDEKTIFGHPRGLFVLFFTEMWERFSFYGMRGLLILYLTQHFLFSDERSGLLYGAYISLVYVMSIIGGVLSDKYLGQRKAVIFGGLLLVAGHFGMAFEGEGSKGYLQFQDSEYEMIDEGRDNRRQLFINYEGADRRINFDSENYAVLGNDESNKLTPINEDGVGDYRLIKTSRSLIQNVCNVLGQDCAGPEPTTTLILNGEEYLVTTNENDELIVSISGTDVTFTEGTDTSLVIMDSATKAKDPMNPTEKETDAPAEVFASIADGDYSLRTEKQELYVNILFFSLALIIAGVGFLKPNISTIVGDLYEKDDPRRDGGFTLFYMGINLGSFLATWTCGIIGVYWGWQYGFGLAGIGMLVGLATFMMFKHWLGGRGEPPDPAKLKKKVFGPINVEVACYLSAILIVGSAMMLVRNAEVVGPLSAIIGVLMFVFLIGYSFVRLKGDDRTRMWAATYFAIAQIPFWSLFEQAGSSLTLFTSRLVNTTILGWNVPTPVFQSLNAGFIFLFAPFIAWLWVWMAKRKIEPSTPVKFSIGVFGVGLGYLALVGGINATGTALLTPVFFIFAIYWIHTMAELMLSPVGLSAMTKLAPAQAVGLTMGAWFVYSGLSNALSGVIAAAAGAETVGGQIVDAVAAKANYASVFSSVGMIAMGIGFVMLLISPIIKKWMAGRG